MPEGDTIYRTATRLRASIERQEIRHAKSDQAEIDEVALVGREVTRVEARGKHLLLHLDDQHVLHSHMGMTGSWHLYQHGESWRKPIRQAALMLEFLQWRAVCFSPKTLEHLSPAAFRRHRYLSRLGPDLLGADLDRQEIIRRFRICNRSTIGEAVMNQTILCGIGNVYKSEVLFVIGIHPFASVESLSDEQLEAIIDRARHLMRKNLIGYPRRTRFQGDASRLWAYGRAGEPCLKCGGSIQMQRQGEMGRSTYWCAGCQRK